MRIKFSYRILSLVLALMVFISTTGVSMDMHLCSGNLVQLSVLGEAASCSDMMEMAPSDSCNKKMKACKKDSNGLCGQAGCCTNVKIEIDAENEGVTASILEFSDIDLELITIGFAVNFAFDTKPFNFIILSVHEPPDLVKDYRTLFQSFLC